MLLKSFSKINRNWRIITLRYFNPGGNHSSGKIGDWPSNFPNNIFPVIQEVILGKRPKIKVFGNDWETIDGSGVRDYIHVVDLGKTFIIFSSRTYKSTLEIGLNDRLIKLRCF